MEELRAMLASGPPSARGTPPAKKMPVEPQYDNSDDFMSAHMKNLRAAHTNDLMNHTVGHQSQMAADNFLMSHLRKVKDQSAPTKSWQGTAAQVPADNFLAAHQKKLLDETGPKTFKSTKLLGLPPKGVAVDNYMMAFVAQVEKEKKGGVSSIGMVPKVGNDSVDAEFLKKVKANGAKGETSIGVGAKIEGSSYMNKHAQKILDNNKPKPSSIGMTTHMPPDSYMGQHLKNVWDINHANKLTHDKAQLPPDSFLIDFHKKSKEANAVKPIPHKQGTVPPDSYLLAQMKELKELNADRADRSATHAKPSIGTDDFTMSVMRMAQKDVMSY